MVQLFMEESLRQSVAASSGGSSPAASARPLASWGNQFAEAFRLLLCQGDNSDQHQQDNDISSQVWLKKLVGSSLNEAGSITNISAAVVELLKHQNLLRTVTSLKTMTTSSGQQPLHEASEKEKHLTQKQFLREIQAQVSLRLALWQWAGTKFLKQYNKHCAKKSKKKKTTMKQQSKKAKQHSDDMNESLVTDIIGFLQLACVKLVTDEAIMDLFTRCIRHADCNALPSATKQIWDFFEKDSPYENKSPRKEDNNVSVDPVLALQLSPPIKKKKRLTPSAVKENLPPPKTKTQLESKQGSCLLSARVSLTATYRRHNSLLQKSARGTFVGSHFNCSLSNAASLFRQAPAVANSNFKQQPTKNLKRSRNTTMARMSTAPRHDFIVPATPIRTATHQKRPRMEEILVSHPTVLETPHSVVRVRPRPVSQNNNTSQPPPAASSLVAEALMALAEQKARRERRQKKSLQQQLEGRH